ncbi:WG repeat-containing protein [Mucilaginibacter robiniae]|uniref:WG repeat-containing protein n=1 Tax=Mucilaginibacter robiniae TaxID=2728022 RepID=A0A7L5E4I1_9SPHI|nr:WG repeat-containing protein [Mucilaginibacter robiniae]QJD97209.1 WG repeat-containing protein [Mucilaginibacter robiniae]
MKSLLVIALLLAVIKPAFAQQTDNWFSYYNVKKDLYGFKDKQGTIKIAPRFNTLLRANVFRNIIAVTDEHRLKSYYLLKNGKQVGNDSLYVWDMTYDCEQEGKIRFRDPKTDKVGFFGANGEVVIPAMFSDAEPFYNGLAVVLYNGKRVCSDGKPIDDSSNPCEHWYWNGITALINSKGNIIADSLDITRLENLNWYSLQISNQPADTTLQVSLKTKDGHYYSFINYEKEFRQWFYQHYLTYAKSGKTIDNFELICVEGLFKQQLRKFYSRKAFQNTYHNLLLKKLQPIKAKWADVQIGIEQLNPLTYTQKAFSAYYTDCGEANEDKYPSFDVIVPYYDQNRQLNYQEHYSFLRTASGYKLIAVFWKNSK